MQETSLGIARKLMPTRREFTKSLAGVVALAAFSPNIGCKRKAAATNDPAKLYSNAFVLDCNTLGSIGPYGPSVKDVDESGVSVVKSTLGGLTCTFDEALAAIAAADQLMETKAYAFMKVRNAADLDRAWHERKL